MMVTQTENNTINVTDIDEEILSIRDTLMGAISNNTRNVKAGTINPIIELYNNLPKQNNKPNVKILRQLSLLYLSLKTVIII